MRRSPNRPARHGATILIARQPLDQNAPWKTCFGQQPIEWWTTAAERPAVMQPPAPFQTTNILSQRGDDLLGGG